MREINDAELISVRNRNNGSTGYTLDNNFHRDFNYNETKRVPFKELRELQYAPGGQFILDNYLVVEDQDALELLNMKVEPEYFYTEEKVKDILFNGSVDAVADFLDFAPLGAIDLAKKIAIEQEIPDVRKRDLISAKTGLNINNAIIVNHIMNDEGEEEKEAPKQRRVQPEEKATAETGRRTATPEYKVVKK